MLLTSLNSKPIIDKCKEIFVSINIQVYVVINY